MIPTPRDPRTAAPGPVAASPHMIFGRAPDGRGWELLPHEDGVIALMERATVAEAHVWLQGAQSTIEFWVDGDELPTGLVTHLVGQAFAHAAQGTGQAVLVCLPRGNDVLLQQVLRHLVNARARNVGLARLVEGSIRDDAVSLASAPSQTG